MKLSIRKKATEYLISLQKSKGKKINYETLKMVDYLLPNNNLTINEQTDMFAIRNRMSLIFSNYTKKDIWCLTGCGQIESMEHIYNCDRISDDNTCTQLEYDNIYNGDYSDQIKVFKHMEKKLEIYRTFQENLTSSALQQCIVLDNK